MKILHPVSVNFGRIAILASSGVVHSSFHWTKQEGYLIKADVCQDGGAAVPYISTKTDRLYLHKGIFHDFRAVELLAK